MQTSWTGPLFRYSSTSVSVELEVFRRLAIAASRIDESGVGADVDLEELLSNVCFPTNCSSRVFALVLSAGFHFQVRAFTQTGRNGAPHTAVLSKRQANVFGRKSKVGIEKARWRLSFFMRASRPMALRSALIELLLIC